MLPKQIKYASELLDLLLLIKSFFILEKAIGTDEKPWVVLQEHTDCESNLAAVTKCFAHFRMQWVKRLVSLINKI